MMIMVHVYANKTMNGNKTENNTKVIVNGDKIVY